MRGWDKGNIPWRRISQSEIRKIAVAKKEAAKARAGKNSFPPTPFLFARPSVQFRFCRAERGNQGFCSKKVRAAFSNCDQSKLNDFSGRDDCSQKPFCLAIKSNGARSPPR